MNEYPHNTKEFDSWFSDETACLHYMIKLHWPDGFECPYCHSKKKSWLLNCGRIKCGICRRESSVTSGTIFYRSHLPFLTWFKIMWHICLQKNGYSALSLQRLLGFSYPTAWLCLHKLRKIMVRTGRELLDGDVEVDESYVGGVHEGKRGRGADGKEIVFLAVEKKKSDKNSYIIGRIRLLCIPDVTRKTLWNAISATIAPGSTIITDGWKAYNGIDKIGFKHSVVKNKIETPFNEQNDITNDSLLPKCHRVVSLLKRWILGTLQGSIGKEHMQDYLDEYTFRFNRRNSKSRGMLFWRLAQMAVDNEPTTRKQIYQKHI